MVFFIIFTSALELHLKKQIENHYLSMSQESIPELILLSEVNDSTHDLYKEIFNFIVSAEDDGTSLEQALTNYSENKSLNALFELQELEDVIETMSGEEEEEDIFLEEITQLAKDMNGVGQTILNEKNAGKSLHELSPYIIELGKIQDDLDIAIRDRINDESTELVTRNAELSSLTSRSFILNIITSIATILVIILLGLIQIRSIMAEFNKELELNKVKNKFITIISHQLRTPLNSIRWNLEALLDETLGKLNKQQKEFLRITYDAELDVIQRIHDMLAVLEIEEGHISTEKKPVSIESLWQPVMQELEAKAKRKEIRFEFKPPKKPLPVVRCDANRIKQVLKHLGSNAVTYTKKKGKIEASLKKVKGNIRFEITDTGIGIPKEEQKYIFDHFYRATNAHSMLTDSSGIGLSVSKYFIEQHSGTIGFTSEEGAGSTFWFEIPINKLLNTPSSSNTILS